jgi:hypothetical protein
MANAENTTQMVPSLENPKFIELIKRLKSLSSESENESSDDMQKSLEAINDLLNDSFPDINY